MSRIQILLAIIIFFVPQSALSQKATVRFEYTYPFVPLFAEGEDTRKDANKPLIIYKEVGGSRIEIANMPAVLDQGTWDECRAFSVTTLLQKYTCDRWKDDIPDCKAPPVDASISPFGLAAFTNQRFDSETKSFVGRTFVDSYRTQRNNANLWGPIYSILENIAQNSNRIIVNSCENLKAINLSRSEESIAKRIKVFEELEMVYSKARTVRANDPIDCPDCRIKLHDDLGLSISSDTFRKALTMSSFEHFLYSILFDGCKRESIPNGFNIRAFPDKNFLVTPEDIKNKIVEGLRTNRPVLLPNLCISGRGEECDPTKGHSLVVSGYRLLRDPQSGNTVASFKVQNSWGISWQEQNNNGWIDADTLTHNTTRIQDGTRYRIATASVIWLQ